MPPANDWTGRLSVWLGTWNWVLQLNGPVTTVQTLAANDSTREQRLHPGLCDFIFIHGTKTLLFVALDYTWMYPQMMHPYSANMIANNQAHAQSQKLCYLPMKLGYLLPREQLWTGPNSSLWTHRKHTERRDVVERNCNGLKTTKQNKKTQRLHTQLLWQGFASHQ